MGNGKTTKHMAMEFTSILRLGQSTRVTGKTICNMALEFNYILMAIGMKECLNKGREMG